MRRTQYFLAGLCLFLAFTSQLRAQNNDVILQGFYWNVNPGNVGDNLNGGIWWDSLSAIADDLADAGFGTIWVPNPVKSNGGMYDMGYAPYDYYDLGDYNQKFTTRTRFGKKSEFLAFVNNAHNNGLQVLADVVLNHRGGAESQQAFQCGGGTGWTSFNPASGRFPGIARHFHPNNTHCDQTPDYHDPLFFEDLCYFNNGNNILDPGLTDNGWFYGPHTLGEVGDSLIVWIRWFLNETGVDALRLDAIKHIEPGFIAPFLVEMKNGAQPFVFGEFYDGNPAIVKGYHDLVEAYNTTVGGGSKNADLAMNDFSLRFKLADICNNAAGTSDLWDLNTYGQLFGSGMDPNDVVTFVDNHDFDRVGYTVAGSAPCGPGQIQQGTTCLELFTDVGHAPVSTDKHLAYAYILHAEGRPTVFWKDYFWYGLGQEIKWLIALRNDLAGGGSTPISGLSPFFGGGYTGADLHVLNRNGGNGNPGSILVLNDKASGADGDVWVNTPFTNAELKDYSDGFLFQTKRAFGDSRANVNAQPRNYAIYAPTGYYPVPPGEASSAFSLEAGPGAKLHHIALTAANQSNYLINGSPIQPGDQVAIVGPSGNPLLTAGMARSGQSFGWNGNFDLLIEVLGGTNAGEANGGLLNGDALQLVIYDQSENTYYPATDVTFATSSTGFSFNPQRPGSKGGAFSIATTNGDGTYQADGISLITAFSAGCNSPAPISTTILNANAVRLNWQAVPDAAGYEILGKPLTAPSFVTLTISNPAQNSLIVNNLDPYTDYLWFMRTVCDAANGVYSDYTTDIVFNISSNITCSAPFATSESNLTPTSVQLNWFFVQDAIGYTIKGRPVASGITVSLSVGSGTTTSFQVNNLTPGTAYEWQVQTICTGGVGSLFTPLSTFTTPAVFKVGGTAEPGNSPEEMEIFPNPFSEALQIRIKGNTNVQRLVYLYDVNGQLVHRGAFNGTTHRLNRATLGNGMYLLEVIGEKVYREKVVVR